MLCYDDTCYAVPISRRRKIEGFDGNRAYFHTKTSYDIPGLHNLQDHFLEDISHLEVI